MDGWMGTVLRVNLSTGKAAKERLREELARGYLGGRGLNTRILWDEVAAGIEPLGPHNKLIISGGPLNGTIVPGSQRFTISSKSPLTGLLGDSNCGSTFGAELKYAGYDAIIIEGRSSKPVYLWLDGDNVEVRDAAHLWGRAVSETRAALEKELSNPDIAAICIGPAGENLVKFACVMGGIGRAAGRTGMGAVFGAKKLKAIVARGERSVSVANPDDLTEAVRLLHESWRQDPHQYHSRTDGRPGSGLLRYHKFGMLPTNNFQAAEYDAQSMASVFMAHLGKMKACFSCPVPCDHLYWVSKGRFTGMYGAGLELAQLGHYGPQVGVQDPESILAASALTDELGVDITEMAGIVGYVMECFEKGILRSDDLSGVRAEWGSGDAVLRLIEMTAERKGIGDTLAEGLRTASQQIGKGSERFAMHVKGLALPMRDVRGSKAWALAMAVCSRGADHCRSSIPDTGTTPWWDPDLAGALGKYDKAGDITSEEGKPEIVKWYEEARALQNSLEICHDVCYALKGSLIEMLMKLYNAVTGLSVRESQLMELGERFVNLERAFNLREGLTSHDDTLPARFLEEPMPNGPAKGQRVGLRRMVEDYYELRGWDRNSGLPTAGRLRELGLQDVADELGSIGKLASLASQPC